MPRTKGSTNKPKVIPKPIEATSPLSETDTTSEPDIIPEAPRTKAKVTFTCKRCGATVEYYLNTIDTNILTHVADYHRRSPKIFDLCRGCCKELSEVVDNWWLEKGKGKFE